MPVFRHRTTKQPFRTIFWVTVIANCVALAWFVYEAPVSQRRMHTTGRSMRWVRATLPDTATNRTRFDCMRWAAPDAQDHVVHEVAGELV